MDDQNKNLILATALSFAVILVWFLLFPPPEAPATDPNAPAAVADATAPVVPAATAPADAALPAETQEVSDAPRLDIDTPRVHGSISLQGGRIDLLSL